MSPPSRSPSGCVLLFGALLILVGLIGLIALVGGPSAFLALFPVAARWWPVVLIAYGALRLSGRLGGGRSGCVEALLLIVFLAVGTSLTLLHRTVGGEIGTFEDWIERRETPFPGQGNREEITIPVPPEAARLRLDLPWGSIRVQEAAGEQVQATLETRAWVREGETPAWPRLVSMTTGEEIAIRVEPPEEGEEGLSLEVAVPPGLSVVAGTGEGGIRVEGPFPGVSAQGGAGPIGIFGARGTVFAETEGGSILLRDILGSARLRGRDTAVEVESVEGELRIEAREGSVRVASIRGELQVDARGTPVFIRDATGPVRIRTDDAPVTLTRIEGDATIEGEGDLHASRVTGALEISLNDSPVDVTDTKGRVRILGDHRLARATGIEGPLEIRTGDAPVFASDLTSSASIRGGDGDITIRDVGGALAVTAGEGGLDIATRRVRGGMTLFTETGDIRLAVPEDARFQLSAESGLPPEGGLAAGEEGVWTLLRGAGGPEFELAAPAGQVRVMNLDEESR